MTAAFGAVALFLAAAPKKSALPQIWIFALIGAAFYFLIYRPQQKKQKAARSQASTYDVGDEVVTAGGIVGRIIDITDDRVTLETSVGASFVVLRPYVLRKLEPIEPPADVVGDADEALGPADGGVTDGNEHPVPPSEPGTARTLDSSPGADSGGTGASTQGGSDTPEEPDAPGADRPQKD